MSTSTALDERSTPSALRRIARRPSRSAML
jgi:hypothetical protein